MLVHIGVPVTRDVILSGHLIISDSLLGQHSTDAEFLLVTV
jgi:hypothetical protein